MVAAVPTTEQTDSGATTRKYRQYRDEVERALAGRLSRRERVRLTAELRLLKQARFLEVNGVQHHYLALGPTDGQALVLVHGWDCSAYWWHHVLEPLAAAGYRVIAYDLKGHGFSDADPAADYTVAGFSRDLQQLIQQLLLGPAHVAAFSLGAFVALHAAAAAPDSVRSLTFFNFSLIGYNRLAARFVPGLLDTVFNRVLRPIERANLWLIPFLYARAVMAKNTPPVNDVRLGTLSLRCCDPAAVRVSAHELSQPQVLNGVAEQMQRIEHPVLLVAGADDPIMRPRDGRALIALAHNGTYLEMPRCGHLILFELPQQVIEILKLFLKSHA
jgi:pimeloyl-ACP methyl ester carboxylesterase